MCPNPFRLSERFFDTSKVRCGRFQNSPFGLKQLKSLILCSPKVYEQKTIQRTLKGIWATIRSLKIEKSGHLDFIQDWGFLLDAGVEERWDASGPEQGAGLYGGILVFSKTSVF